MPPMMAASPRTPTTTPAAMPAVFGPFFSVSGGVLLATAELAGAAVLVVSGVSEAEEDEEEGFGGCMKGISLRELPVDITHSFPRPPPRHGLVHALERCEVRLTKGPIITGTCRRAGVVGNHGVFGRVHVTTPAVFSIGKTKDVLAQS